MQLPKSPALLSILCALGVLLLLPPHVHSQASATPITGWAWSDNVGWISLDGPEYGLTFNANGTVTGYAWGNIGWIRFGGLSGVPTGAGTQAANARFEGNRLVGWARACTVFQTGCSGPLDPDAGGWDGWLYLGSTTQGGGAVADNSGLLSGFAWGDFLTTVPGDSDSQTFTSSGTFVVPAYTTLTVQMWGGGGGGAGDVGGTQGAVGGTSTFSTLSAGGGLSGFPGVSTTGFGGTGGAASGGTTNTGGNTGANSVADSGGAGGAAPGNGGGGGATINVAAHGNVGQTPGGGGGGGYNDANTFGGGGGGSGAYASRTYSPGELPVDSQVLVTIGAGGAGGNGTWLGGNGARGELRISWTAPPVPTSTGVLGWVQFLANVTPPFELECIDTQTLQHPWGNTTQCQYACVPLHVPGEGACTAGVPTGCLSTEALPECAQVTAVRKGEAARLYWSIENASACTLSGQSVATSSPPSGWQTPVIQNQTRFTLACNGQTIGTATINIIPQFRES
jgi:hypothetical protein